MLSLEVPEQLARQLIGAHLTWCFLGVPQHATENVPKGNVVGDTHADQRRTPEWRFGECALAPHLSLFQEVSPKSNAMSLHTGGRILHMNLLPDERPCWRVTRNVDGTVTLHPSIWAQ